MSNMADFEVRIANTGSFPYDPRHEQMRSKNIPGARLIPNGRHPQDQSRLLNLPVELLWRITEFIAAPDKGRLLSQFALVSSKCRQLAQPHQFADVVILRSDKTRQFLEHILNKSPQTLPAIGSHILSLTVRIIKERLHNDVYDSDDKEQQWCAYWQCLVDDLAEAVEVAMPNLQRVFWMDTAGQFAPHLRLFPAILRRAHYPGRLRLLAFGDYKFLLKDQDLGSLSIPPFPLGIRDLAYASSDSEISHAGQPYKEMFKLAEDLLRRCASTLETFIWSAGLQHEWEWGICVGSLHIAPTDGFIDFPRLRKFWAVQQPPAQRYTEPTITVDTAVFESLLAAPLESFAPSAHMASFMIDNRLTAKYPLPQLYTFAITATYRNSLRGPPEDYADQILQLASHYAPQIRELFIYPTISGLESSLAPHLASGGFSCLRSLCFSWIKDPDLAILKAIGSNLGTLEELSFGIEPDDITTNLAFCMSNYPPPPRHDDILAAISPLRNLVRLGIFGDEYIADWCGRGWAWHRYYKDLVWFNIGRSFVVNLDDEDEDDVDDVWAHGQRGDENADEILPWLTGGAEDPSRVIVDAATKYAAALPKLQQLIAGRLFVEITRTGGRAEATVHL